MHDVLFVLIWPLAALCPFLPRSRFVFGAILFMACEALLWHATMKAMSEPEWNESVGDVFVPLLLMLPVLVYAVLVVARVLFVLVSRVLLKHFPSDDALTGGCVGESRHHAERCVSGDELGIREDFLRQQWHVR